LSTPQQLTSCPNAPHKLQIPKEAEYPAKKKLQTKWPKAAIKPRAQSLGHISNLDIESPLTRYSRTNSQLALSIQQPSIHRSAIANLAIENLGKQLNKNIMKGNKALKTNKADKTTTNTLQLDSSNSTDNPQHNLTQFHTPPRVSQSNSDSDFNSPFFMV
jgi:hypothetical protein